MSMIRLIKNNQMSRNITIYDLLKLNLNNDILENDDKLRI